MLLSEDDVWQINDVSVGNPSCAFVSLEPYNGGSNPDKQYTIDSKVPLIARSSYRSIVKTRSNIRDLHLENNIGVGTKSMNITFPELSLGGCVTVTLQPKKRVAYIVGNVPESGTLVLTSTVSVKPSSAVHELYVRNNKPATAYNYDASSKFVLSADQKAVVSAARPGDNYVLMERTDTPIGDSASDVTSQLCAKLAKFEIVRVTPASAAPLGQVTLHLEGTLFSEDLEVKLINISDASQKITASRVYRLSSTDAYASFNTLGWPVGSTFHLEMTDISTGRLTRLTDSFKVTDGIPGKLQVSAKLPRALRPIETGLITVDYQNNGNTDILSPMLLLRTSGIAELSLVQEGKPSESYSQTILFLGTSLKGPAGILSPGGYGRAVFRARNRGDEIGSARIQLQVLGDSDKPHPFVNSSDDFKPSHLAPNLWEPVWQNFLFSVGNTRKSLQKRLSSASSLLSTSGRRINSVDNLVDYQLNIANGKMLGKKVICLHK